MKHAILVAVFASLFTTSTAWSASTDEAAVTDAMQQLSAAMIAGDAPTMKSLTADNLTYGHSNGRVQNQTEFIETIASGATRYRRIDLSKSTTTIVGDNAVIRDHFNGTTESAGKVTDVDFDVLLVWQKQPSGWKLIARQGYKH